MKMILYKALFDYKSADKLDLNFKVDDLIEFLSKSSEAWYYGNNLMTGSQGLFPHNFVAQILIPPDIKIDDLHIVIKKIDMLKKGDIVIEKQIENEILSCLLLNNDDNDNLIKVPLSNLIKLKSSTENCGFTKCVANCNYVGSSENELTFSAKDTIWMKQKINDDIGEGILNGNKGIFFLNKVLIEDISYENIDRKNIWLTLFDYPGSYSNDLLIKKGEKLKFLDRIDNNWNLMQNESGKVGMVPCSYVKNISIHAPLNRQRLSISENGINEKPEEKEPKEVLLRPKNYINELMEKNFVKPDHEYENLPYSDTTLSIRSINNFDLDIIGESTTKVNHINNELLELPTSIEDNDVTDSVVEQFYKREKRVESDIEVLLTDIKCIQNKCSRDSTNADDIQILTCNLAFLKEEYKTKLKELEFVKEQKSKFLSGDIQDSDDSDYDSIKLSSVLQKQANKRIKVIEEILETEKKFINDLKTTLNAFDKNLLQAKISDQDYNLLFGDLESVTLVAEMFLSKLSENEESQIEDIAVGSVFIQSLSSFEEVYKEYCVNYDRKLDLINKKMKNLNFSDFLNEGLTKLTNLGISTCNLDMMLVKPLQRFLKYPLFLKTIIENTGENHPDLIDLQAASVAFEILAKKINEKKRFEELRAMTFDRTEKWHMKTLHAIQKKPKRVMVTISGVAQELDNEYQLAVTNFKNLKKCISFFIDTVFILRDNLKEVLSLYSAITDDLTTILKSEFCSKLNFYLVTCKRGESDYFKKYLCILDNLVVNPLNKLLDLFSGPILLIKKRQSKHIDYLGMKQRCEDKEMTRIQIDKMEQLKNQYLAINNTLKDELPKLTTKSTVILNECLANYLQLTTSSLQTSITSLRNLIEDDEPLVEEEPRNCKNHQNEILQNLQKEIASCQTQNRISLYKGDFSSCYVSGNNTNIMSRNWIYHQTPEDVLRLQEKFSSNDLARVKKDFIPTKPHQIHICAGILVGILKRCNPQGHSSSWLVEVCPKRTGFVPRSYLALNPTNNNKTDSTFYKDFNNSNNTNNNRLSLADTTYDLMQFASNNYTVSRNRTSSTEVPMNDIKTARSSSTSTNIIRAALFNHQSRGESEISMQKNDHLELLESHDKCGRNDWSLVKNLRTGAQGYVPTNYLSK